MKKILFFFSIFLLSACTVQAIFTPAGVNLNDATVGIPYYSEIKISGGRVLSYDIDGKQVIAGNINPDNTGLHVQYCDEEELNNCIQIRGRPKKAGIAKVRTHGGLSGGMLSKAGEFDRTYIITIKGSKGSL